MSVPEGFKSKLARGFATLIAAGGLGAFHEGTVYTVNETGIHIRKVPQELDRAITLSAYGISDQKSIPNAVVGLQVRCRWGGEDPCPADDLDDAIFDLLNGYAGTLATGIHVAKCWRASGPASLGQDGSKRWSVTSNYAVTVYWPSSHRVQNEGASPWS